jgi:PAS domain S-box-containing protein
MGVVQTGKPTVPASGGRCDVRHFPDTARASTHRALPPHLAGACQLKPENYKIRDEGGRLSLLGFGVASQEYNQLRRAQPPGWLKGRSMALNEESRNIHGNWIDSALADIGVATIVTDVRGHILFMNPVAESLTGWPQGEAAGQPVATVFRISNDSTRQPLVDPVTAVLSTGSVIGLANHIILTARDGTEWVLDDGAAVVRDSSGAVLGAVLVFRDVSERRRGETVAEDARAFAESIVGTIRQPLLVLDAALQVRIANRAFYESFRTTPGQTEGQSFFNLGNRQWDIPALRELLEEILPRDSHFDDFAVDHTFDGIGRRSMVLNARRLPPAGRRPALILLAIEDVTERRRAAAVLELSEIRYRRLFETAQDGILLVDPATGRVFDANPFITNLLGYSLADLVGKELWEIGLFRDIESNKAAFRTLQEKGYIRYEDLPLRTHDGRGIEVEFVSNVYDVGDSQVIQCNIRDVTDRKRAEEAIRKAHSELETRVHERTSELAHANGALTDEIVRRERAEADRRDLQRRLASAQEEERRRIARELHDQMGQHLTALGLGLKVVKDATPISSPSRERLQGLQSLTDLIGREIHNLALELRPTALDDHGLQSALSNYADGWAERSGIEVDFHGLGLDGTRLPSPVETALYRVVQEALTNVLKHAAARRVSVVLQRTQGQVTVVIEDDGRGFDADSTMGTDERRLGLLGMRERVALLGGDLTVDSAEGRGTTVIARVPLAVGDGEVRDA